MRLVDILCLFLLLLREFTDKNRVYCELKRGSESEVEVAKTHGKVIGQLAGIAGHAALKPPQENQIR